MEKPKVDVFYAVFQSKPEDVSEVVRQFKDKFGEEVFQDYLANFVERRGVKYIFGARTSKYKTAFLRALIRVVAKRLGMNPDLPEMSSEPRKKGVCANCWEETDLEFLDTSTGNGQLCNVCLSEVVLNL